MDFVSKIVESIEKIFSKLLNSRDLLKKFGEALNLITSNIGNSEKVISGIISD